MTLAPHETAPEFRAGSRLDARPDDLRRASQVSTHIVTAELTRVQTRDGVVGFIRSETDGFAALRGRDLASASKVGLYRTRGLALEAVRLRRRSI